MNNQIMEALTFLTDSFFLDKLSKDNDIAVVIIKTDDILDKDNRDRLNNQYSYWYDIEVDKITIREAILLNQAICMLKNHHSNLYIEDYSNVIDKTWWD